MKLKSLLRFLKNPLSAVWLIRTRLLPRIGVFLRSLASGREEEGAGPGKVALFHVGRSGSTVLGDLLYQDKRLFWDGEVIRQFIREHEHAGLEQTSAYIRQRTRLAGNGRIYGCEIKPFHIQLAGVTLDGFVAELERAGFTRFIVLERRNYLRKIVSSLIAAQTERWHNSSYEKAEHASVTIDPACIEIDDTASSLLDTLDTYAGEFARLREVLEGRNLLWLSYEEDISNDPRCAYAKVCEFLALPPGKVATRYAKTNPWPLAELIDNYREIRDVLEGTPYAWMTNDHEGAA
jgi:LPS sulfotransferase NodH